MQQKQHANNFFSIVELINYKIWSTSPENIYGPTVYIVKHFTYFIHQSIVKGISQNFETKSHYKTKTMKLILPLESIPHHMIF